MRTRLAFVCMLVAVAPAARAEPPDQTTLAEVDKIFADWRLASHVPGLAYGIVSDGRLVHARGLGVQNVGSNAPVTLDSLFRIASMSKAFTAVAILKLRDEGKLGLDAPVERYVPELRGWRYPTADSPAITVRDLLTHTAGFVEDNPWGDRQQVISEDEFTAMLKAGVPFARTPGTAMEYSNFGYATLGRIVRNISGMPYQDYIRQSIIAPLGMASTTYDIFSSPAGRRAIGYRWQDNRWVREPDMRDGAFGAMGGIETSANDYWRWVAFLLCLAGARWPGRRSGGAGDCARDRHRREFRRGSDPQSGDRRGALPPGDRLRHGLAGDR